MSNEVGWNSTGCWRGRICSVSEDFRGVDFQGQIPKNSWPDSADAKPYWSEINSIGIRVLPSQTVWDARRETESQCAHLCSVRALLAWNTVEQLPLQTGRCHGRLPNPSWSSFPSPSINEVREAMFLFLMVIEKVFNGGRGWNVLGQNLFSSVQTLSTFLSHTWKKKWCKL